MARITSVTQRHFTVTAPDQSLYQVLLRTLFNTGTGFDNYVYAITLQPDGKILVGGDFTSYNGVTQNRITRLNADGSRDTGFVIGTGFNPDVRNIILQSDGKIVVSGALTSYNGVAQNRITRLNTDGSRDTSFVGTGFVSTILALAIQPDGKILVGGDFSIAWSDTQNYISRLNADGTRDTSFVIGTAFNGKVIDLALQPDGKILVGGSFTLYNGIAQNRITRLNSDGSLDTSFVIGTGFNNAVYTMVLQPNGQIVAGGAFTTYNGVTQNRITRLNADGSLDTSFVIGTGFFTNSEPHCIAIQPDGKIVVGGQFQTYNGTTQHYITRLNTDGTRDTNFYTTGWNGFGNIVYAIALQSDGNILAGGAFTSYDGFTHNRIARLTYWGARQPQTLPVSTYAVALPQLLNTSTPWGFVITTIFAITLQPNGKILVGGSFDYERIIRLNEHGTYDNTFLIGLGFNNTVYAITLQPDGKIIVGGDFTTYQSSTSSNLTRNRIIRLTADGDIDYNFVIGTGFNINPYAIAVQPDGKILVGGSFTTYNGTTQNCITRLNADGTRDTGFSSGTGFTGGNGIVYAITLQPDGKILVGGAFTTYNGVTQNQITRLNTDGTRDTGFSSGAGMGLGAVYPRAIALQPDGKILVGGNFLDYDGVSQLYITRLNADGTRDTGFSIGTGFNDYVSAIALQSDGKILVGGGFTTYNGATQNRITRLNSDGSRDTSFVIGTGFTSTGSPVVYAITLQPNGKILVGGDFTAYKGVTQNRICMLNVDGTLSTTLDDVREGSQYNFTMTTANVRVGTVLRWRILDRAEDFTVNTNTVTVTSNTASITVTPTADLQTEGVETFRVQLEKITGTIVAITSNVITINDTSTS